MPASVEAVGLFVNDEAKQLLAMDFLVASLLKLFKPDMQAIFLATLGQRPEAITMALDVLDARFHYDKVGILYFLYMHRLVMARM